jgi:hypothetical protein
VGNDALVNLAESVADGCLVFGVFTVHLNDEVVCWPDSLIVGVVSVAQ